MRGDVRDPNLLKDVLQGVDMVYHFAATVGVGQSMYEISRYMSVNTQGTAELLQAILDNKSPVQKIVVASSMSILWRRALCLFEVRGAQPRRQYGRSHS